jgi:hypothetical protein
LDDADDTLPARLTRYLEKQGFSRAVLDHFVQLADPNALEPMTRNIANNAFSWVIEMFFGYCVCMLVIMVACRLLQVHVA